jgi:hypothetical protein
MRGLPSLLTDSESTHQRRLTLWFPKVVGFESHPLRQKCPVTSITYKNNWVTLGQMYIDL